MLQLFIVSVCIITNNSTFFREQEGFVYDRCKNMTLTSGCLFVVSGAHLYLVWKEPRKCNTSVQDLIFALNQPTNFLVSEKMLQWSWIANSDLSAYG
ncbi:hypothetical protein CEXT_813591 [Caerostris extrusa]|uniref:Uncharacterized protein n=1 Tax=Caerostris extrusa TaxID=172846 RepID=A0AAV4YDT7_CAEEX|nr:hypothetical protein CEXT_813591 [Caerostris extrusa]